jgi:hypothetical protein
MGRLTGITIKYGDEVTSVPHSLQPCWFGMVVEDAQLQFVIVTCSIFKTFFRRNKRQPFICYLCIKFDHLKVALHCFVFP